MMINPSCKMIGRMVMKIGQRLYNSLQIYWTLTCVPTGRSSFSRQVQAHPHSKVQNTHPGEEVTPTLHCAPRKQNVWVTK